MCRIPKTTFLFVALLLLATFGCETVPSPGNKPATATANSSNNPPPQPEPASPKPRPESVTLPVLDAFFAQPDFERDLKAKLQLSDDQINKLKTVARQETSKLRENQFDDSNHNRTATARDESYQRVRQVVGDQKTQELMAFVIERWSGSSTGTATSPSLASSSIPVDNRVVVNIPAFRMDLFEDGKLIKSYKVGTLSKYLSQNSSNENVAVSLPKGSLDLTNLKPHTRFAIMAAGSGVTPMISVIDYLLDRNTPRT